jgi:hypothetical protein
MKCVEPNTRKIQKKNTSATDCRKWLGNKRKWKWKAD